MNPESGMHCPHRLALLALLTSVDSHLRAEPKYALPSMRRQLPDRGAAMSNLQGEGDMHSHGQIVRSLRYRHLRP